LDNKKQVIHAHGKLLLSAEYFVLDGATSLALPTSRGQNFNFEIIPNSHSIFWISLDEKNEIWFEGIFSRMNFEVIKTSDIDIANRMTQILNAIRILDSSFLKNKGAKISSHLEFPRNWGLGTSSTLIYSIAKWAGVNPFELLEKTFGGSGYDIACAGATTNILYSKIKGVPQWLPITFNPTFKDQLYFIYLGKKQNSREAITHYRKIKKKEAISLEISEITQSLLTCTSLYDFEKLINQHEDLIAITLHLQKVKDLYFDDYWGSVKSLGAWGGDFVLATSDRTEEETREYFRTKGFNVFLKYEEMILV